MDERSGRLAGASAVGSAQIACRRCLQHVTLFPCYRVVYLSRLPGGFCTPPGLLWQARGPAAAQLRRASQASAWESTAASSRPVCIVPSTVTAEGQPSQLTGRV